MYPLKYRPHHLVAVPNYGEITIIGHLLFILKLEVILRHVCDKDIVKYVTF